MYLFQVGTYCLKNERIPFAITNVTCDVQFALIKIFYVWTFEKVIKGFSIRNLLVPNFIVVLFYL